MKKEVIIKRLTRIKYLYTIGIEQSMQVEAFAGFSILAFHDAAEMFLVLAAEKKNKKIQEHFMDYWGIIKELTQNESMRTLNSIRNSIKHKGTFPEKSEIERMRYTISEFFKENTPIIFGLDFDKISLSDLIEYPLIKEHVSKAEEDLKQNRIYECLVSIREGFELLLSAYESNKCQLTDSILNVGVRVGTGYQKLASSGTAGRRWFEQVTKTSNEIRKMLKVTALGIDYKKYVLFDFITPKIILTCGPMGTKYVAEPQKHFEETKSVKTKDCQFCIDFVVDSALKLQEFDFNIHEYLSKQV